MSRTSSRKRRKGAGDAAGTITRATILDYFHLLLHYYDAGEKGIAALRRIEDSIRQQMKIRI